jgi:hypothetical protein
LHHHLPARIVSLPRLTGRIDGEESMAQGRGFSRCKICGDYTVVIVEPIVLEYGMIGILYIVWWTPLYVII